MLYAPMYQSTSSDATGLQCIIGIVILIVAAVVLASLASKTKNAAPSSRAITTSLSREQATELVKSHFPKSMLPSTYDWKISSPTPDRLTLSGYYLTTGQGCLVLLLTGIIPGDLFMRLLMGRTEQVTIDFSKLQDEGKLTFEAKGLRAQREVNKLADELGARI